MVPTDRKLLALVRKTVADVASRAEAAHDRSLLAGVDVVLNELVARQNADFYPAHYAAARRLAAAGRQLLKDEGLESAEFGDRLDVLPETIQPGLAFDRLGAHIDDAAALLQRIVAALAPIVRDPVQRFLRETVDWEAGLFAHRLEPAVVWPEPETVPPPLTRERLQDYLRARFPDWGDVAVTQFRPLVGGFSKTTILFETNDRLNGPQSLVARVEPLHNFVNLDGYDIAREFAAIRYGYEAGLPIPEPVWLEEDASRIGARFLVSRKAEGATLGTVKEANAPLGPGFVDEVARVLAQIHAVPLDPNAPMIKKSHLGRWLHPDLPSNTAEFIQEWRLETRRSNIDPSPLVERALQWLERNVPAGGGRPVLLHGDFGLHNMLVENGRISAVLDWEGSRVGDPADDLTNLLSGNEGRIDRRELLARYRAAGGADIDEYRLRYFDVYHCVKIAIACLAPLRQVEDYESTRIGHAVFGLQFAHFAASRLNELIGKAEAARG